MIEQLKKEDGFIEFSSNKSITNQLDKTNYSSKLSSGAQLKILGRGIVEIKPQQPSNQYLVLSCGVHGNETAPIEIVSRLLSNICLGNIEPKVNLLLILGNPESMLIAERFVEINMNRLFNQAYKNYERTESSAYEIDRAKELETYVTDFFKGSSPNSQSEPNNRIHFDLHTAIKPSYHKTFAIRPFNEKPISKRSKCLLNDLGIEAILQHNKPSTTFSAFSVETFNAEAYTLELGKVKPFGENKTEDFQKAIDTINQLVTGAYSQDNSADRLNSIIEYSVVAEIIKQSNDFKFYVDNSIENFTPFNQGELIADDIDYQYRVGCKQESVVFPNANVPVGQRVAVMVTAV